MAMVSENQYEPPQKTRPSSRPMYRPFGPHSDPMPMKRAPRAASSTNVLMVFLLMSPLPTPWAAGKFQVSVRPALVEVAGMDVDAGDPLVVEHLPVAAVVLERQDQVELVVAQLA